MNSNDAYDVAVIGYGPSGVTAANLLGAMGLRVAIIERDASVFARARAISTDEEVLRIWQRLGLSERLKQDMLAGRAIDFVDERGRAFVSADLPSRGHGHPPQMFIYQPALEEVLRKGVDRYPNVEVLLEHECLRLSQDASGVDLAVANLRDDSLGRLRARYVIAADGGSSLTRAQLNIGYEGRTYEDRWVVIDTKMIRPCKDHDRLRFHCDPDRPAVDCPTPLGHHRWEFPVLQGEDETYLTSKEAIWKLLECYGIGEENVRILRATVYSHHVRFAERWRSGRIFLAGDAAHAMPPWIGQGMAAGVRDVANLCWKLGAVLRGELPESVLDTYESERKPHVRGITERAVLVGRIITERRRFLTRLRNPVLRGLDRLTWPKHLLQNSTWIPEAHYPQGLSAPISTSADGRLIPQPRVIWQDRPGVLLDDLLGTGWCLVHAGVRRPQPAWDALGIPSITVAPADRPPALGTVIDEQNVLWNWMARHRVTALALRPDRFVYAAAHLGSALPAPPLGFTPADRPASTVNE